MIYRLADNPNDYKKCRELMRSTPYTDKLHWPTVIADKDGDIVGFISTQHTKIGEVEAGPLVVEGKVRSFKALRLIEAYEKVLIFAGVSRYIFSINKDLSDWLRVMEKVGLKPYGETEAAYWFMRVLNEDL